MRSISEHALEIFTEALKLPAGQRSAFLEESCAGREDLRRHVEALLKSNEDAGNFLETPPTVSITEHRAQAAGEKPGDRIGHYKLLQQIGEGGCGIVFMAEQEEPVRRCVALKIIKPGMDTKNVIARFEAERQALAMMDHPNIAKIFDAGTTELGRPYFVMELVRGIKITDYCDQHSLTTKERLQLFVQVCQAIQHAHQKGVIHRDIKPSNILVTTTASEVVLPVVIDFGIAKATRNQNLTDETVITAFELLIGTPAYMSPEQAALTGADVDTRTDIYSLGVLFYELLTGSTPFATGELLQGGVDGIRRMIQEVEPACPSTRLSKLTRANLTTVAQSRGAEPPALIRSVRGDLDWITMKALEKDRTRRYPTANALALDVQRFIANEAIWARPPSKAYKLQKTFQRNKLLFGSISAVAALLVVSLIVVSAALTQERQSRREAQTASTKSQQVTRFLEEMLQGVEPSVALGQDTTLLRGILDRTARRIGAEMTNQPAVEAELRRVIGRLYFEIGNYDGAEKMLRAALAFHREQNGSPAQTAEALNDLGVVRCKQNFLNEAEQLHQEALEIRRVLRGPAHPEVATSLNNLAAVYRHQRRLTDAEVFIRQGLRIREDLYGREHPEVAESLQSLSQVLRDQNKGAEAEAAAREVLAMRRRHVGDEHPLVAAALLNLAAALSLTNKLQEAEWLQEEAFAMQRKLLGDEHPELSVSLSSLGETLKQQGNLREARMVSAAALTMQRKMFGENSPEVLKSLRNIASVFESRKKYREAEEIYREVLEGWRKRGEGEGVQGLYALESVARTLIPQKKSRQAEQLLDEALTPALIQNSNSLKLLNLRVKLKARRSQWQQAAADAAQAFEYRPADQTRFPVVAALLLKTHNFPQYEKLRQTLISTWSNTTDIFVADHVAKSCLFRPCSAADLQVLSRLAEQPVTYGADNAGAMPYFQICKALSEYRLGNHADAAAWGEKTLGSSSVSSHAHASAVVAMAYWKLGRKEEARALLARGEALAPPEMPTRVADDSGDEWKAWLYARIQLDEAVALIGPTALQAPEPTGQNPPGSAK